MPSLQAERGDNGLSIVKLDVGFELCNKVLNILETHQAITTHEANKHDHAAIQRDNNDISHVP